MKILMVNKFLHPNGGSETYIFKLGEYLSTHGHEVQYFGMEHEGRIVGNQVNAYTSDMDFHGGSKLTKLTYPIKTIYSAEARRKIRLVLDDFQPNVVHLNNFTYQLTPSIILEIVKWRKQNNRSCRIIFTAHDYNLICPNHMLYNPNTHEVCEKCLGGHYLNCIKGKCIHGSTAKSIIGAAEGFFWKWNGAYKYIDKIICPSEFLKSKMDTNPIFASKTVKIQNFIDRVEHKNVERGNYVLFFGRYCEEKGLNTLIEAAKRLPDIPFIFAGSGPLEDAIKNLPNIENVGFQTGERLDKLIREARFVVCPSEWYENCPFSVMESQERETPVVGSKMGGIPELIQDDVNGKLFMCGDSAQLCGIIKYLYDNPQIVEDYKRNLTSLERDDLDDYYLKMKKIFEGGGVSIYIPIKSGYILYFGRYNQEKGIETLIEVCKVLKDIPFVFAGSGPLEERIKSISNIHNVGFKKWEELRLLIQGAKFTICPSEWYEPFGLSIVESITLGTPVIATKIGGIPELVDDGSVGKLVSAGDKNELASIIEGVWKNPEMIRDLSANCKAYRVLDTSEYVQLYSQHIV